jgi:hypothetical protein
VSYPPRAKNSGPGGPPTTSASTRTGHKRIHHPVIGILDLDFEAMEFPAHPGLTLLAYTAAAGTSAADSPKMLASWAVTAEQTGDLPAGV